jgi:hypothetical protein
MAMHLLVAANPKEAQKELKRMSEASQQPNGLDDAQARADMGFNLSDPWFCFTPPPPDADTLRRLG